MVLVIVLCGGALARNCGNFRNKDTYHSLILWALYAVCSFEAHHAETLRAQSIFWIHVQQPESSTSVHERRLRLVPAPYGGARSPMGGGWVHAEGAGSSWPIVCKAAFFLNATQY